MSKVSSLVMMFCMVGGTSMASQGPFETDTFQTSAGALKITFGDKRVYIAGDTENIPEMKALKDIDIAFLPMNLPFTMTPEMAAAAALMFKPKVLYPYHYGDTDVSRLTALLRDAKEIDVRIRKMK